MSKQYKSNHQEKKSQFQELIQAIKNPNLKKTTKLINQMKATELDQTLELYNNTALHIAAREGHTQICKLLLENNKFKKVSAKNDTGNTALHLAAQKGHVQICKLLLESNKFKKVSTGNNAGNTALHLAAQNGYIEICELLLEKMSITSIVIRNDANRTAYEIAIQQKNKELAQIIKFKEASGLFFSGNKEEAVKVYQQILDIDSQYSTRVWSEIERLKLESDLKGLNQLPRFVINTIAYVPDRKDTMSGDSSDEEYSSDEEFKKYSRKYQKFTDGFPFKTYKTKVSSKELGKFIGEEIDLKKNKKPQKDDMPTVSNIVGPFSDKLSDRGFKEYERDKLKYLVKTSIGLNRPKSLSTRKNKVLEDELRAESISEVRHEKFGFYWEYNWYNDDNERVEYDTVHKFYKQLKKYDKKHRSDKRAEKFREENEQGTDVPYQNLREHVAEHDKTQLLVQEFRDSHPQAHIYFSFIDSDTVDFNGIYSTYLRIYKEQTSQYGKIPTVMSTGYEFRAEKEKDYPYEIGSKLDRAIRVETAKHIPLGVYYPEPNFCVLLPQENTTLPERFTDDKDLKKLGNSESVTLLRQVNFRKGATFIFSDDILLLPKFP